MIFVLRKTNPYSSIKTLPFKVIISSCYRFHFLTDKKIYLIRLERQGIYIIFISKKHFRGENKCVHKGGKFLQFITVIVEYILFNV